MEAADLELLTSKAAALGQVFGFGANEVKPVGPILGAEDQWLVTGSELASQRANWSDIARDQSVELALPPDATLEEMAERAFRAEAALARVRSRRTVRLSESLRRATRDRSPREFGAAARILLEKPRGGR